MSRFKDWNKYADRYGREGNPNYGYPNQGGSWARTNMPEYGGEARGDRHKPGWDYDLDDRVREFGSHRYIDYPMGDPNWGPTNQGRNSFPDLGHLDYGRNYPYDFPINHGAYGYGSGHEFVDNYPKDEYIYSNRRGAGRVHNPDMRHPDDIRRNERPMRRNEPGRNRNMRNRSSGSHRGNQW